MEIRVTVKYLNTHTMVDMVFFSSGEKIPSTHYEVQSFHSHVLLTILSIASSQRPLSRFMTFVDIFVERLRTASSTLPLKFF